ncbi:non-homologous end-joining DNA ligase [Aequorivita sp. SDUM287046]|uniref:Non-homologous end-joining DNA ligase n=1 Tax=Aequorivita aurantiaca TaxID=3053356 RepID=A0ABT8DM63_9FLAO|nr:non-homologous end-joining DNA ligase [Aequorivita aurantiaca]MDN3724132.1 non-homologous end-joining DNA ligase [Aequorivita aurantiaca]
MKLAGTEITNPEKILFPQKQITKLQLVEYYHKVAEKMLPYLKNRPLTLHRFPNGIDADGFYQKNASDYFPDFIKTVQVKTEDGTNTQIICNDKKTLVYLANQGTIAFHIWLSQKDMLNKPNKIVFDLDPSENSFEDIKKAAKIVGDYMRNQGQEPKIMTTGQHGLHVWASIRRTKNFDEIKEIAKNHAQNLENEHPELFTTSIRKNKRNGKIFLDYLRNAYAQTSVCPYSVRANDTASVAMPIDWKSLDDLKSADAFTIINI